MDQLRTFTWIETEINQTKKQKSNNLDERERVLVLKLYEIEIWQNKMNGVYVFFF